ncbi:MAG: MCE family protein [Nitrospirae bacterium]|nr:MCE family protein [Nitrospirota bacterium]
MKRSTNMAWAELKVGILLVAAVLIGTVSVVSFSGIREYFRPTFEVHAHMEKVAGLKTGAVVMLSGVMVGNVAALNLAAGTGQGVDVTLKIYTQYQNAIRQDAKATLGSQGLLGDKYIEIEAGSGDARPVRPGDIIASGGDPSDITGMVGQAEDATRRLNTLIDELTALTRQVRAGQGSVTRLLDDPALFEGARDAARQVGGTARELSGTAREVSDTAKAYAELGERLRQSLVEQDGTLKRLAQDPAPFEHLTDAIVKLDAILLKVSQGEGSLGRMVNDDQVADELTGLLQDMRRLVKKIEEHPKDYLKITVF